MNAFAVPNKKALDIRMGKALPELLCPAGTYRALEAAIEGGADAIYMGGAAFNARMNAANFSHDEMKRGIALAHAYGAKVYIAANTLIHGRELDDLMRAAEDAYLCGADALIVADVGAAREIRKRLPIELHASTQLSGHGADCAHVLAEAGFSRMVCAREMSREDIRTFTDSSPLEAEVFVHGALCVCHSGQCLFSSLVGGRSGNRGECAQPCRLPYRSAGGRSGYPLSLKDLCLAGHIPELCELGVASLKIEGRMKSPEYVRDVTRIWRRLLDERRAASAEDMAALAAVFSRDGFTDGYFTSRISTKMLGVRSDEQKRVTREIKPFEGLSRRIGVDMSVSLRADEPMLLEMTDKRTGRTASVTGDVPFAAINRPLDESAVIRSVSKLGDTPYAVDKISVELDEGLMLPVSALNAIRRRAVEALLCAEDAREPMSECEYSLPTKKRGRARVATFCEPSRIPERAKEFFDVIYVPLEKYDGSTNGVALPPVIFDSERETVGRMLDEAIEKGACHVLVGNLGHISLVRGKGVHMHGDLRLNVYNSSTAAVLESHGFEDFILSPELTLAQMRDVRGAGFACVYGRMPLMVTEKCVAREISDCKTCDKGRVTLTDRKGISFPVMRTFEHRSVIFNSVPVYMADKADLLVRHGLGMQYFLFTTESAAEADAVITAYLKGLPSKGEKTRIRGT